MFGLVVLEGTLLKDFLGEGPNSFRYMSYLYDLQYGAVTAWGPLSWGSLRGTFGNSAWPKDSPMHLSPDGQPAWPNFQGRSGQSATRRQKGRDRT